jgi:hypothetical protein
MLHRLSKGFTLPRCITTAATKVPNVTDIAAQFQNLAHTVTYTPDSTTCL